MRVVKKVLVGLGVVLCLVLVLAGSLLYLSAGFADENERFARDFLADYSQSWETSEVYDRVAASFLEEMQSANGEQVTAAFRRLGALQEITDVSLENFFAGTEGKTGVFVLKARFEAAPTVVRLTVREADSRVQVIGLYINPASELQPLPSSPTRI